MKYQKRPSFVEAFRLGVDYIPNWFMDKVTDNTIILHRNIHVPIKTEAHIKTHMGWDFVHGGDYVIKDSNGEVYSCKPYIFEKEYVAIE